MGNINYNKDRRKIIIIIFSVCVISCLYFYNNYAEIKKKQILDGQAIYLSEVIKSELKNCILKNIKCFDSYLNPADIYNKDKFTSALEVFVEKKKIRNPYSYFKEPSVIISSYYETLSCGNNGKNNGIIISTNDTKVKIKVCFSFHKSREEEFLIKQIL